MIFKKLIYCSFILLLGCGVDEPKLPGFECPGSEDFSSTSGVFNMSAGQKLANRFNVNGITTAAVNLSSVRFFMSTSNITSVNVKLYLGEGYQNPEDGTLLNSTTVAVGSNNPSVTTPVDITLSSSVQLLVEPPAGKDYFIVIDPTPGAYSFSYSMTQKISGSRIDMYNAGNWSQGAQFSDNLSMIFYYSGCSK